MIDRISYMKGLAEGLEVDFTSKEGKLLKQVIHVLEDMSFELQQLQSASEDIEDYVEAIDDDLQMLEQDYYEQEVDDLEFDDYDYEYTNGPIYLEEEIDLEDYEDQMM